MVFVSAASDFQERVYVIRDEATGLRGAIAIHSTALGPAVGGCRLGYYDTEEALQSEALRFARCMSFKTAMAGLPFGGGKAILQFPRGACDREALFQSFAKTVRDLKGDYVTASDVGTTADDMVVISEATHFVAGLPHKPGRAGGDPAPWTALGVFEGMKAAARFTLERDLRGLTVAVQGVGNVGAELCRLLHAKGAQLIVTDINWGRAERIAARYGARLMAPEDIAVADADVFAPCAMSGILNEKTIADLRARIVCGGADNQLASKMDGWRLMQRGIAYAPDYVVNAGGIISVAGEYLGEARRDVAARVRQIGPRIRILLRQARLERLPANIVADELASDIIASAARPAARRTAP